ncbi:hypothetical protein Dpep_0684 [Dethiosulfovibrio peptidovorans DSM 11002]|uniref:Uncharacterized protein n=1 Tax=Dethiosulfovibrio peptidovorans DSM 11002 TaxID=469381 RepID=D2Z5G5_9BACT|nr:hypothetical protein [Dethiosulfovibrio peptidovorans]EFC90712.1 hypothetical protein Dpep_0684 [Dethiosulfovibrio peptidovorans DSM 11002]
MRPVPFFAVFFVLVVGSVCLASTSIPEIWMANGMVQGIQPFRYGEVDWESELAYVAGEAPLPERGTPSEMLRCRRAARVSLFLNCYLLSHELTGTEPSDKSETDGGLFEDVMVLGGERNGSYVVGAWIPLDRIVILSER